MGKRRRRKKYPRRYCPLDYVKCTHLDNFGMGIATFKDKPCRIHNLLPGEEARIIIFFEDNDFISAKAIMIKEKSQDCKLDIGHPKMELGSYTLAHLTDKAHDKYKQDRIQKLFGNDSLPIKVGKRTYYRNKVSLTNGGFMPPGSKRRFSIVPKEFDLMDIDFPKYSDTSGPLIIRRLDTEIAGKPGTQLYTTDTMMGKTFKINLNSFYQVNSEMSNLAYSEILKFVLPGVAFDLFGGAATIGIIASDVASLVYSVEINRDSHNDAIVNIKANNAENVEAICADANEWVKNTSITPDTIIIDPARAGLSAESANIINESKAKRIIYLSCNIDTQARDVEIMDNYKIVHIQPYDFFPQTYHIENLIIMDKK